MIAMENKTRPVDGWQVQIVKAPACPACDCKDSFTRSSATMESGECKRLYRKCRNCGEAFPVLWDMSK